MITPWTVEQRSQKQRRIEKEADRAAAKIGAKAVYIIACFDAGDKEHIHFLTGGRAPMPAHDLLKMIINSMEKLELSGGEDVSVQ